MPTYEYECTACGRHFDVQQAMSDEPLDKCPDCGGKARRIVTGGAGFILKGDGFYATDARAQSCQGHGRRGDCDRSTPCCGRSEPCDR
ncbi:MAG: zinc ribbon domain-containing protein [Candidatus Coatesbacteria bacterium]|nr:zinc ribbon domain-containing protein [Candidatus Coatesbacteria bacterium]